MGNFSKRATEYETVCAQHTHVLHDTKVVPFERRIVNRTA